MPSPEDDPRLEDEHAECRHEIERLRKLLVKAYDELHATPELNVDNPDEELIRRLNDEVCNILCWLEPEAKACREAMRDAP